MTKPINITGTDEVHLKCDIINGCVVNGIREPILYNFGLDKPIGHKLDKDLRIKFSKKVIKHGLSHITFYLEDDHKPVQFLEKL